MVQLLELASSVGKDTGGEVRLGTEQGDGRQDWAGEHSKVRSIRAINSHWILQTHTYTPNVCGIRTRTPLNHPRASVYHVYSLKQHGVRWGVSETSSRSWL
jgi:hypothetical protein